MPCGRSGVSIGQHQFESVPFGGGCSTLKESCKWGGEKEPKTPLVSLSSGIQNGGENRKGFFLGTVMSFVSIVPGQGANLRLGQTLVY